MGCPSQFLIHLWPFQKLSEELLQILKSCLKILPEGARVRKFAGLEAGDPDQDSGIKRRTIFACLISFYVI